MFFFLLSLWESFSSSAPQLRAKGARAEEDTEWGRGRSGRGLYSNWADIAVEDSVERWWRQEA